MQNKISKTLEAAIARTTFDTAKNSRNNCLGDRLVAEVLREEGSLAFQILSTQLKSWELYQLRLGLQHAIDAAPESDQNPETYYRDLARRLQEHFSEAPNISTAHLLLYQLADPASQTTSVLSRYHITKAMVEAAFARFNSGEEVRNIQINAHLLDYDEENRPEGPASGRHAMLDKFGVDLTERAREGKIDPVVGREREIERVIQILSRRKKNNPVLIGEAGVGKSAIVEGLALRMAAGEVPYTIQGKRLYSIDISSLVAGTKFRGEFEERMQQLLDELRRADDVILFIDEIHTIVGAGSTQGSLDTANILKPALARGELQTIGATTLDEYREQIEQDAALERRFQRVMVEPTTAEETYTILKNIAPRYEHHHKVRYTDEALRACVTLTGRFITDRYFPDKAIDILDEAGARMHLQTAREPVEMREMEQAIQSARRERREAVEALVYEKAASARLRELALRSRLGQSRAEWRQSLSDHPAEIRPEHIAQVITSVTGIPAERVAGGEMERLRNLGEHLSNTVVGQQEAVERVARSIRRSRTGLKDERRPVGVFLFVGPTGVGKTLLAKELSKWLFDERQGLIRIDMSEYGEKHNVARLIGSPPGYVGYGEGGQLTEAVRRHPYSVVLFDEIEKAHPDVFNLMLQLFDEGWLTDGQGRRVDFRNTVIIMTSNAGSREVSKRVKQVGYNTSSKRDEETEAPEHNYRRALEEIFAPEFLNRVDDIILFRTLEPHDVERIIELELSGLLARTEQLGYTVRITDRAKRRLAELGYESRYGVRSLKRTLCEKIEEPLSGLVIDEQLHRGDTVLVEADEQGEVVLRVA